MFENPVRQRWLAITGLRFGGNSSTWLARAGCLANRYASCCLVLTPAKGAPGCDVALLATQLMHALGVFGARGAPAPHERDRAAWWRRRNSGHSVHACTLRPTTQTPSQHWSFPPPAPPSN
jgi:hypothetical protein